MTAETKEARAQLHAVGPAEVILPFRAAGAILHAAATPAETRRALREADGSPPGSLILVVEESAAPLLPEIRELEAAGRHALLLVPTRPGKAGLGAAAMRSAIVRSVGVDLMGRDRAPAGG